MSSELDLLRDDVRCIKKDMHKITEKVNDHDVACDKYSPMAEASHEAHVSTSKMMSDLDHKINMIIKENLEQAELRQDKNDRDELFQAEMRDSLNALRRINNLRDIAEAEERGRRKAELEAKERAEAEARRIADRKYDRMKYLGVFIVGFLAWMALEVVELKAKQNQEPKQLDKNTKALKKRIDHNATEEDS